MLVNGWCIAVSGNNHNSIWYYCTFIYKYNFLCHWQVFEFCLPIWGNLERCQARCGSSVDRECFFPFEPPCLCVPLLKSKLACFTFVVVKCLVTNDKFPVKVWQLPCCTFQPCTPCSNTNITTVSSYSILIHWPIKSLVREGGRGYSSLLGIEWICFIFFSIQKASWPCWGQCIYLVISIWTKRRTARFRYCAYASCCNTEWALGTHKCGIWVPRLLCYTQFNLAL